MAEPKFNPVIIGATPAGSFLASELAKEGQRVIVLDENESAEKFSRISGLVPQTFLDLTGLTKSEFSNVKINEIKNLAIHFPSDDVINFELKNPYYVVDNQELSKLFHSIAASNGAKFYFGNYLEKFVVSDYVIGRTNMLRFQAEVMVGADGVNSTIAKKYGLSHNKLHAVEAHCRYFSSAQSIHLLIGKKYSETPYAWVIPEDQNHARIGLICSNEEKGKARLNKLLHYIDAKPLQYMNMDLPADFNVKNAFERILLLGDAGAQSKANSLGELTLGMAAAKHAWSAILSAYETENFSAEFFNEHYSAKVHETIGNHLKNSMKARKMSEALTHSGWNKVQRFLSTPHARSIVESKSDISFLDGVVAGIGKDRKSQWLLAQLAVRNPRILSILGI